jgi:hypothetical protein
MIIEVPKVNATWMVAQWLQTLPANRGDLRAKLGQAVTKQRVFNVDSVKLRACPAGVRLEG